MICQINKQPEMHQFRHFQTFLKIPEKGQKFQSKDKTSKSESTGKHWQVHH